MNKEIQKGIEELKRIKMTPVERSNILMRIRNTPLVSAKESPWQFSIFTSRLGMNLFTYRAAFLLIVVSLVVTNVVITSRQSNFPDDSALLDGQTEKFDKTIDKLKPQNTMVPLEDEHNETIKNPKPKPSPKPKEEIPKEEIKARPPDKAIEEKTNETSINAKEEVETKKENEELWQPKPSNNDSNRARDLEQTREFIRSSLKLHSFRGRD